MQLKRTQTGFTLVEIAIVLVIIGLLLGGILKGQEMITQARIKNVVNDFNGITAAYFAYQDRYRQIPGDDNQATTRWVDPNPPGRHGERRRQRRHRRRVHDRAAGHRHRRGRVEQLLVAPASCGLRGRRDVGPGRPGASR